MLFCLILILKEATDFDKLKTKFTNLEDHSYCYELRELSTTKLVVRKSWYEFTRIKKEL